MIGALPRFWSKVAKATDGSGCWIWTAAKSGGYGRFFFHGKPHAAHRLSFISSIGPIPDGLELDHLCRNRACVNPSHLEPVTSSENKLRSPLVGRGVKVNRHGGNNRMGLRSACKWGHSFDSENVYVRPGGHRRCKECARVAWRAYKSRRMCAVGK